MGFFDFITTKATQETWEQKAIKAATSYRSINDEQDKYPVLETIFDGEKTWGELGAPLEYLPAYSSLSYRSWQAFTDSDIAQIIVKAHVNWVIGSGLKFQAEPISTVIDDEGFNFDRDVFVKKVEPRFRLFSRTSESTHSKMYNFNKAQRLAYLNAIVGGDVLWIHRLEDDLPTIQLIDGIFIQTPGMDEIEKAKKKGNDILHGVEISKKNKQHIAYHILNQDGAYTRIEARGSKTKKLQAKLIYGTEYRIDSVRGMPLLSAVLEKIKKLDRYNEAVVGSAEERAKIPYFFQHDLNAEGLNPDLARTIAHMTDSETEGQTTVDVTEQTKIFKRTYEKEPINNPPGTSIKSLESKQELNQETFTTGNFIFICAAVDIPYEVALMKYVNSFSSSRMASQSWGGILKIKRSDFNDNFNKPFYNFFLDTQILTNKIKADGYFSAINKRDTILLEAYRNCRFIGPSVPQADPFKEVKAEVEKLKNNLTTHDLAIEILGSGEDFDAVIDKLAIEHEKIKDKIPNEENLNEGAN